MGVNRYVYADGITDWYDTYIARTEKLSKGYNGVSLTNYNTTSICAIAEGSSWEQGGSGFFATAETAITGSVATGICYIYSTATTAAANISWSQTAPTWRNDYCGYYWSAASTTRALGGLYYDDDGEMNIKFVLRKQDQLSSVYYSINPLNNVYTSTYTTLWTFYSQGAVFQNDSGNQYITIPIDMEHGALIKYVNATVYTQGAFTYSLSMMRKKKTSDANPLAAATQVTTIMTANQAVASATTSYEFGSTVTSYAIINNAKYMYFAVRSTSGALGTLTGEWGALVNGYVEYFDLKR